MPTAVYVDASPGRGFSKLSKALSKLNLRSPGGELDSRDIFQSLRKEQIKLLKQTHPNARDVLSRTFMPVGLTKGRLGDYVRSISITPRGTAFLPRYSEIVPDQLYISDYFTGTDIGTLSRLRITHVVSILHAPNLEFPILPTIVYHDVVVPCDAYRARSLVATIDDAVDFMDSALRQEDSRVLVYCRMGVQWSPTMIIAWLMRNGHCDYGKGRDFVLRKRQVIAPGMDLEKGVKEWWALEMARPVFPLGRGGRCRPSPSVHHLTWGSRHELYEEWESDESEVLDIK